jgi:hypothetical protein
MTGKVTYNFPSKFGDFIVENNYYLPFTSTLTFNIGESKMILYFTPHDIMDITLNVCIIKDFMKSHLFDWVFQLLNELPFFEDVNIIKSVYLNSYEHNKLDASDEFIKTYRDNMKEMFPELLEYYLNVVRLQNSMRELQMK